MAEEREAAHRRERIWVREALLVGLALGLALAVVALVDLSPEVESDFFFSTDDPQLATSKEIDRRFPARPQLFLRAAADDLRSPAYVEEVGELTRELEALAGVESVQSLTSGPSSPSDAFESPFWSRLLVADDGAATYLVAQLEEAGDGGGEPQDGPGESDGGDGGGEVSGPQDEPSAPDASPLAGEVVAGVERAVAAAQGPELRLDVSGVPYVVELVRRHLTRDLRVFSLAAFVVFGLMVALLFRSLRLSLGMLASCLTACALTLGLLSLLGVPIGLLTANLVTIVFVLTLSHMVFLTANHRRAAAGIVDPGAAVKEAVARTFGASFWCMATTLLGFASLQLAPARPLRELGTSGVVGTAVAILVAYSFFPPFLLRASGRSPGAGGPAMEGLGRLAGRRWTGPALAVVAVCLLAGTGLLRASADPSLLAFFKQGSELREGLEAIDRDGGSSPLSLVVRDPQGGRMDGDEAVGRLQGLQAALEEDPSTGVVLSLAPLLAEARRQVPPFLSPGWKALLDVVANRFPEVARSFVSEDRGEARFFIRMRESGRSEPRGRVIERLTAAVREQGLEPELVGGLYELQGALARLVARSLLTGLGGLLVLFAAIAGIVSRELRVAAVMVGCLVLIPLLILGTMGHLGMPLDFISSPAAQVAIAIGVDSMIHLAVAARRARRSGAGRWAAWVEARRRMALPILGSALVVGTGFGIFGLSSFPPTQRFGTAVVLGTLAAAAVTLVVLPWGAAATRAAPDASSPRG